MRNTVAPRGKMILRRIVLLAPILLAVCSGAWLGLLARYHRREQRRTNIPFLDQRSHERLLSELLVLGVIMLGVFILYALFGAGF